MHIHCLPFAFLTITKFDNHLVYIISLMTLAFTSFYTSWSIAILLSTLSLRFL